MRRRGRRLVAPALLLLVVSALAVTALRSPAPMHHGAPAAIDRPAELRGTYRVAGGDLVTVVATTHGISYERGGTEVVLRPAGEDRFEAADDPDETLVIRRAPDGRVAGIVLGRTGTPPVTAARGELYTEQDVVVASGDVELAGTLVVPAGPGPHPGVAWVHGAGPADRSEFQLRAAHLARRGVASLLYDKRGVAGSTGSYADAGFQELADDAAAVVAFLAAQPQVDPDRVGVAGFSQGAWVAAMTAQDADVAFVVSFSGSGFTPAAANAWLHGNLLAVRGLGSPAHHAADRFMRMLYSSLDLVDAGRMRPIPQAPGFWFHALDPHLDTEALWNGVHQPVLGIWGALDCQVPAEDSAAAFSRILTASGTPHSLQVLPGADHGLRSLGPCDGELGRHPLRWTHPGDVLAAPSTWIHQITEGAATGRGLVMAEAGAPPLGWHLPPPDPAPWQGRLVPQLLLKAGLLLGFAALAVTRAVRRLRGRGAGRGAGRWTAAFALGGMAAVVIGTLALVEVYTLGGMHAAMLVEGPAIAGRTPLLLLAEVLAGGTLALGVAHTTALLRQRRTGAAGAGRSRWAVLPLTTALLAWAAYWGFLPG